MYMCPLPTSAAFQPPPSHAGWRSHVRGTCRSVAPFGTDARGKVDLHVCGISRSESGQSCETRASVDEGVESRTRARVSIAVFQAAAALGLGLGLGLGLVSCPALASPWQMDLGLGKGPSIAAEHMQSREQTIVASALSASVGESRDHVAGRATLYSDEKPEPQILQMAFLDSKSAPALSQAEQQAAQEAMNAQQAALASADEEHALLDQVWQTISKHGLDQTFNAHDWGEVRSQFMKRTLSDRRATYAAAREMTKLLGDKYSRFLEPSKFAAMSKYDITGSGMLLAPDEQGVLTVSSPPRKDSAAFANGIRLGDKLLQVEGKPLSGMTVYEAASLLGGEEGSILNVQVQTGPSAPRSVQLTRHFFVKNPVPEHYAKTVADTVGGGETKVGYIRLTEFNASCLTAVRKAIEDLESQGVNAYVLDLRDNPGGILEGAVEIAGLFLKPDAVAVRVLDGRGNEEPFLAAPSSIEPIVRSDPLAIVTNGMSASSSEVLSGALQDNCRALTAGAKTYGKGVIQAVFGFSDGSGMVLTVAKYQTPAHREIQGQGILPDLPLRLPPGGVPFDLRRVDFDIVQNRLLSCSSAQQVQSPSELEAPSAALRAHRIEQNLADLLSSSDLESTGHRALSPGLVMHLFSVEFD
ncbi:Carboxyl-terminal-processing peptidase 2, chloroplastic [Porphyridium purpureum]|uniref:Carboxyl-terminal-processing peptidase 2, chloroplastic n=1 Tax=Porphyridium purpureum TaxID=35688 RepID=A0A5J4YWK8_PORPP|nr:Carboxyl-terminal-processing peptidase 2, chloroplastic [Porphyridium purpureum]|eukprot:POR7335..scf227_4